MGGNNFWTEVVLGQESCINELLYQGSTLEKGGSIPIPNSLKTIKWLCDQHEVPLVNRLTWNSNVHNQELIQEAYMPQHTTSNEDADA